MKLIRFILPVLFLIPVSVPGQTTMSLTDAIKTATDSSLAAFKAQNLYMSSYWEYRTYIAQKKPALSLNTILLDYNRALNKVYNSVLNINEYIEQQDIYSSANASVRQNLPFSGGTLYFDSELSRLQNFGQNKYTQFSTVPLRIGLNQPVYGYNMFKWQKKIAPIKYEKAKKSYLQSVESISLRMVDNFFDLLVARIRVTMSSTNVANADTLYNIGQKRLEIASLSLAEVLTLKVDVLNARNDLAEAKKQLKNSQYIFNSYLRLDENKMVDLVIPENLPVYQVSFDEVLQMALLNNPDLLGYQQQILESESELERTKRQNLFNASLNASFGLNQQNSLLPAAYRNPMDQQRASIALTVPIIDWGQGRGKVNMARKNFEVTRLTVEQANVDFRQQVMMTVTNFNMQLDIVKSASETRSAAQQAYEMNKQRFVIGKADVNSLGLALNRQDQANINYLNALRSYWRYYYNLRQLTLYDFENRKALLQDFDEVLGVK
jgi:outer membrane protein TolC